MHSMQGGGHHKPLPLQPVGDAAPLHRGAAAVPRGCRLAGLLSRIISGGITGRGQLLQSPELGSYRVPTPHSWGCWTPWMLLSSSPPTTRAGALGWAGLRAQDGAEGPSALGCWCRVPPCRPFAGSRTQAEFWPQHSSLWRKNRPAGTQLAPCPHQGPQELTCARHPRHGAAVPAGFPGTFGVPVQHGLELRQESSREHGHAPWPWKPHEPHGHRAGEEPSLGGAHMEQAATSATELGARPCCPMAEFPWGAKGCVS